ncbi:PREDICTED: vesicle-associated membrane protein 7-like isoform X2 [Priapulus caudatus]|uniref:Vesicle-associated membrane protein 7-like isoform X2 n=1 Tax=Priapulus caudatus TaxID=37621 RepID=A0ABM1EUF9_PRICU|nr:PREDICTED: vesicle-associated membrane protein 7-like isoform X2 [Priapulus caudatus]
MPILYSVVARGVAVLAKYAGCAGNFAEVTEQILAKIPPENGKLTYSHANYLFHYVCEDRIIYMCITDDVFERSRAFLFLQEIKSRFQTMFGPRAQTALPFAFNTEFSKVLASQMKYYSDTRAVDPVSRVQTDLDELKGIMVKNIVGDIQKDKQEFGSLYVLEKCKADYNYRHCYHRHNLLYCLCGMWRPRVAKMCWKVITYRLHP